jgi:hypothetical protein
MEEACMSGSRLAAGLLVLCVSGLAVAEAGTKPEVPCLIETNITGTFDGYGFEKVYRLLNGQVWEQTGIEIDLSIRIMPRVIIWESAGTYKMWVEGMPRPTTVQRLK